MKISTTAFFLFFSLASLCTQFDLKGETPPVSETTIDIDKISETLGHLLARQLDISGFSFNIERVIQGLQDEKSNKPSPMTEEEYEQAILLMQENLFFKTAEKNLTEANDFLEKNALVSGVKKIDSKLQYKVSKEGSGSEVRTDSTPLVHYQGKLIDGTVFANSKEPISLPIKQTISGVAQGIVGMKEGEKRILYIHPELAYGVSGQLPPNSLLIFEVEIVKAHHIDPEK